MLDLEQWVSLIKENHWRIVSSYQWYEINTGLIIWLRRERSRFEDYLNWKHGDCAGLLSQRRITSEAWIKYNWEKCSHWKIEEDNSNDEERQIGA